MGDRGGGRASHLRYLSGHSGAGWTLANVGVHGAPVTLHLEKLWNRNITITRLVDTTTTPMLKGVDLADFSRAKAGHAPLRARRHHARA